jgi:hypothetical protein
MRDALAATTGVAMLVPCLMVDAHEAGPPGPTAIADVCGGKSGAQIERRDE